jgi:hypothetical protein
MIKKIKKLFAKCECVSKLKKKAEPILKKVDRRIIVAVAGGAIFLVAFGAGSIVTHWKYNDFKYDKKVVSAKQKSAAEYKDRDLVVMSASNPAASNTGTKVSVGENKKHSGIDSAFGTGYRGQNMRDNLFVVLAVKSILLIVLIAILIVLAVRIWRNYEKVKKTVHVRQLSKTHRKAVKIKKTVAKKKRK